MDFSARFSARIVDASKAVSARIAGLRFAARPDVMPLAEAEVLARLLAGYTPLDDLGRQQALRVAEQRAGQEFLDVFGINDAREWDPTTLWDQMKPAQRLKV